jgi:hypothetical protein
MEGRTLVKTTKYLRILLITVAIMLFVIGAAVNLSCKPTATTSPSSNLHTPKITPDESQLPHKLLPAYAIDIQYPSEEGFVTVKRGGSFTLPVTVRSLVDVPMKIRLALNAYGEVPEYVEYELPKEYTTLNPGESFSSSIAVDITINAPTGSFYLGVTCELEEPVQERGGESMNFLLTISDG